MSKRLQRPNLDCTMYMGNIVQSRLAGALKTGWFQNLFLQCLSYHVKLSDSLGGVVVLIVRVLQHHLRVLHLGMDLII